MSRINTDNNIRVRDVHEISEAHDIPEKVSVKKSILNLAPNRQPTPLQLDAGKPKPLSIIEIPEEYMAVLKSASIDQISFELSQIYLALKEHEKDDNSLEVKQGLKAIEEQIRLFEHLHVARTSAIGD